MIKKEPETFLKYKDLATEIQRMWNVKTKEIPVRTGATGTISKTIQKTSGQHTWKVRHQGIKENSHTGHCAHTSENTNAKAQNVYHGKQQQQQNNNNNRAGMV